MPRSPDPDRPLADVPDAELARMHLNPRFMNLAPGDTAAAMQYAAIIEEERKRAAGEAPSVPRPPPKKNLPAYKFPL